MPYFFLNEIIAAAVIAPMNYVYHHVSIGQHNYFIDMYLKLLYMCTFILNLNIYPPPSPPPKNRVGIFKQ